MVARFAKAEFGLNLPFTGVILVNPVESSLKLHPDDSRHWGTGGVESFGALLTRGC